MSISRDDPRNVDEGEILTGNLDNLIGRISGPAMSEIDCLVSDLQAWRQHVEYEGERVQRTITEFAQLKQAFAELRHAKPPASRAQSAETYVVAKGFRGSRTPAQLNH